MQILVKRNYFPENLFSVAAKRVGFTENDFRKRFLANSNTALEMFKDSHVWLQIT